MDQIIFCEIDGCLVEGKHAPYNLEGLAQLRHRVAQLAKLDIAFCLCTARPQPYAESMAQILGLKTPFICESGAFVFHPKYDKPVLQIKDSKRRRLMKLRKQLRAANYSLEMGREGSLSLSWEGLSDMRPEDIARHRDSLADHYRAFGFKWSWSTTSIDVGVHGYAKSYAAAFLLARYGLKPENAYAIGGGRNDRRLLDFVEVPMCIVDAPNSIKERCVLVAEASGVFGVVELLNGVLSAVSEQGPIA